LSTEQNLAETAASEDATVVELAKPENIESYVEERAVQTLESGDTPIHDEIREIHDKTPEIKRASRYERLKRARDSYKAEAEDLRRKLGTTPRPDAGAQMDLGVGENSLKIAHDKYGETFEKAYQAFVDHLQQTNDASAHQLVTQSSDPGEAIVEWYSAQPQTDPENPYLEEIENGRREAETAHQLAERDRHVAEMSAFRTRAESVAQQYPDFNETCQAARDLGYNIPDQFSEMVMRSPHGPLMAYALAKDAFDPNGQGALYEIEAMGNDPVALARTFGRMEQAFAQTANQTPQKRATSAPAPLKPIRGGAGGPKDLASLAKSDDAPSNIPAASCSTSFHIFTTRRELFALWVRTARLT
jgi:hypothetical protein